MYVSLLGRRRKALASCEHNKVKETEMKKVFTSREEGGQEERKETRDKDIYIDRYE